MTDQTERRSPHDEAFAASILAMIGRYADRPKRLSAYLNGLHLDGSLRRAGLPSGLAPYARLPAPESDRSVRTRMAELIVRRCSADGCVTREDLTAGGFTDAEITRHFHAAKRAARVTNMAA